MSSAPHYSPIIQAGDLLLTSGQLPLIDRKNKISAEGIIAQTELVLQKVEDLVSEYGLDRHSIIKTTAFITDIEYWGEVNDVYARFFGKSKPARSIVPVPTLHFGCLIELEAIASIK